MRLFPVFSSASTSPARPEISPQQGWLTVGLKLLLGVALASNSCIALLLSINHGATMRVETMMTEVLDIRDEIDTDLRGAIVQLQGQFLNLPHMFLNNPAQAILQEVERSFTITKRLRLTGRDQYGAGYSRTEKRDLTKGKFVAAITDNQLTIARGLLDDQGLFLDAVELLVLASEAPAADYERLQTLIAEIEAKSGSAQFYEEKLAGLRALVADKSLEAEQSRTKILGYVDRINLQEQQMRAAMERQQYQSLYAGLAAVCINILALFLLTRIIIERPLGRLTALVESLGAGQYPEIPWCTRRDQIGVLCAAMARFRTALLRLQQEEQRKEADRKQIEHLVDTMSATIHGLDDQAAAMAHMALALQEFAGKTEAIAIDVAGLADDTARRTLEVGDSSWQINAAVGDIHRELAVQNTEVNQFMHEIGQARRQLEELRHSVGEIDTIVAMVRVITDQTRILALNATIEAVKAGEFGRGFVVVADEVKKLSQDTALATRDVREKIEAINRTCQVFITSFDSLDNGASALQQVTRTIDLAVERQRSLAGAIVALSRASGENTREVSTRIDEVSNAAANVLNLSRDTRRHAEEIAAQLGHLLAGSVTDLGTMCRRGVQEQQREYSVGVAAAAELPKSDHAGGQRTEQPTPANPILCGQKAR